MSCTVFRPQVSWNTWNPVFRSVNWCNCTGSYGNNTVCHMHSRKRWEKARCFLLLFTFDTLSLYEMFCWLMQPCFYADVMAGFNHTVMLPLWVTVWNLLEWPQTWTSAGNHFYLNSKPHLIFKNWISCIFSFTYLLFVNQRWRSRCVETNAFGPNFKLLNFSLFLAKLPAQL